VTESKPPVSARVLRTNRSAASTAAAPPSVPVPPPPAEPPRAAPPEPAPSAVASAGQPTPDDFAAARARMVERQLRGRGIADERVLAAMAAVPRERFVLPEDRAQAYDDTPLAIGYGQTISQPYIVALQLEQLELRGDERLLEVGAGSGYAAAVASQLVREVVATERIGGLAARAARALANVGATNARVLAVDGQRGVPGAGPFDAILVSAAAERFPERLYHELAVEGRIVVPVGDDRGQRLELVRRGPHGPEVTHGVPCRFVPLLEGAS
jgi:protein-L-isoaspartate(D-aspartate) O-methyltransferase